MKRELGIARCGLACCLCSENAVCSGCDSGQCPDKDWCENRKCSIEKEIRHCYECDEECRKGLLGKIKPYAFTLFVKRYELVFSAETFDTLLCFTACSHETFTSIILSSSLAV